MTETPPALNFGSPGHRSRLEIAAWNAWQYYHHCRIMQDGIRVNPALILNEEAGKSETL
jgi:hypothetical protein